MRKNRIREVAALFGQQLYEPFIVRNDVDKRREVFRFSEKGIEHFIPAPYGSYTIQGAKGEFHPVDFIIDALVTGRIWIEEKEEVEQGSLF